MHEISLIGVLILAAFGIALLAVIGYFVVRAVRRRDQSTGQRVLIALASAGALLLAVFAGLALFLSARGHVEVETVAETTVDEQRVPITAETRPPVAEATAGGRSTTHVESATTLFAKSTPDMGILIAVAVAAVLALVAVLICVSVGLAARRERWSIRQVLAEFAGLLWVIPVLLVCGAVVVRAVPQLGIASSSHEAPPPDTPVELGEGATTPEGGEFYTAKRAPDEAAHAGEEKNATSPTSDEPEAEPAPETPQEDAPQSAAGDLPSWIGEARKEVDDETTLVVLSSGQYVTVDEAEQNVLRQAERLLMDDFAQRHAEPGAWTIPPGLIRTQSVRRKHVEDIERTIGGQPTEMHRAHWQVELSPEVREELETVWREQIVGRRLLTWGALFGQLTLMIVAAGLYLRLDTLTGGAYRKRLKLAAVLLTVAGGLVAVTVLPTV